MAALPRKPAGYFNQTLIDLLVERSGPGAASGRPAFAERLDALEVEALAHCAPDQTLIMIRAAREAVQFAERTDLRMRGSARIAGPAAAETHAPPIAAESEPSRHDRAAPL